MAGARPEKQPVSKQIKAIRRDTLQPRDVAIISEAERRLRSKRRFIYDLVGVGLIALSFIILGSLIAPTPVLASGHGENLFGKLMVDNLRLMIGVGSWLFPFVVFLSGVMLAVGRRRSLDNVGGTAMAFLVFITWWHLGHTTQAQNFDKIALGNYGGIIGAGFTWCLRAAVGQFGGHVILFGLTIVAVLWMGDISLPALAVPLEYAIMTGAGFGRTFAQRGRENFQRKQEGMRQRGESTDEVADEEPYEQDDARIDDPNRTRKIKPQLPAFNLRRSLPAPETERAANGTNGVDATKSAANGIASAKTTNYATAPAKNGVTQTAVAQDDDDFALPPLSLLKPPTAQSVKQSDNDKVRENTLIQTLEDFGIGADVDAVVHGPAITRYEIKLDAGIKVSKIVSLADNLAMSLAAMDVRIEAPIPGKSAIGIEVPNENPVTVTLREVIQEAEFLKATSKLTVALGKDVEGRPRYADLTKMPHLLIGGTTGSGKSVCLNTIICSLLYRATPQEVKFLMIDPKKVELSLYNGIPHLAAPVITDVKQAPEIFKQAIREMETRYDRFVKAGTRNIEGFNSKVSPEERLPYWVLIVDELADLMMQSGPEIEGYICRLAQLSRATGIHLIIATQRPSVNVITGTIKANISSRIAFAVNSLVDSRTILDMSGAERLIGRGDMLFMPLDAAKPQRIQGCFVSERETEDLVGYLKNQAEPVYSVQPSQIAAAMVEAEEKSAAPSKDADDELFEQAVKLVVSSGTASTSMLQRRFKIGYGRAARLVDLMELRGIVGPLASGKTREILMTRDSVEAMFSTGRKF